MTSPTPLFTTVALNGILFRREDDGTWIRQDQTEARIGDLDSALDRVVHLEHAIELIDADLARYQTVLRLVAPHLTPEIIRVVIPGHEVPSTP